MHFTILTMSVFAGLALAEGPGTVHHKKDISALQHHRDVEAPLATPNIVDTPSSIAASLSPASVDSITGPLVSGTASRPVGGPEGIAAVVGGPAGPVGPVVPAPGALSNSLSTSTSQSSSSSGGNLRESSSGSGGNLRVPATGPGPVAAPAVPVVPSPKNSTTIPLVTQIGDGQIQTGGNIPAAGSVPGKSPASQVPEMAIFEGSAPTGRVASMASLLALAAAVAYGMC